MNTNPILFNNNHLFLALEANSDTETASPITNTEIEEIEANTEVEEDFHSEPNVNSDIRWFEEPIGKYILYIYIFLHET